VRTHRSRGYIFRKFAVNRRRGEASARSQDGANASAPQGCHLLAIISYKNGVTAPRTGPEYPHDEPLAVPASTIKSREPVCNMDPASDLFTETTQNHYPVCKDPHIHREVVALPQVMGASTAPTLPPSLLAHACCRGLSFDKFAVEGEGRFFPWL